MHDSLDTNSNTILTISAFYTSQPRKSWLTIVAPGEKVQKGPAAQSPARKKQKITGATASTTTKKTRFRDTVCDFDDDVMKEVEKQDGKRL